MKWQEWTLTMRSQAKAAAEDAMDTDSGEEEALKKSFQVTYHEAFEAFGHDLLMKYILQQ